ncbi:MAG TPA: PIN domain-containing protein [Daejeonella sp.]|nr:PIN domain-containing protein [Daejeonella sp.]
MGFEKVFVDSDILLDLFFDRKPHSTFAIKLFDIDSQKNFTLYTSTLITANLYYVISKQRNKDYANECISILLRHMQVLPMEVDSVEYGLSNVFGDFEDAIQYHIAKKNHCTKILSRNIKDYKQSSIPVMTAENLFNY